MQNEYALIDLTGVVLNTCVWDGVEYDPGSPAIPGSDSQPAVSAVPAFGWSPPDGQTAVIVTDETGQPHIGLTYNDGVFEQPALVAAVPPTPDEVKATNAATLASLLDDASVAIAPLQLAISLGEATDNETASAKAWVGYTRELKAIDLTNPSISWPEAPSN